MPATAQDSCHFLGMCTWGGVTVTLWLDGVDSQHPPLLLTFPNCGLARMLKATDLLFHQ